MSLPADYLVWAASAEADFLKGKYVMANWDVAELKQKKEEIIQKRLLEIWLEGNPRLDFTSMLDLTKLDEL